MHLKKYLMSLLLLLGIISFNSTWAFSTKNGNIYDSNGNQVAIDGIAWIGFQDGNFLAGLSNVPFNPMGTQNGVIQLLTAPWNVPGSNITSASNGVAFKTIRLPIQPGIWQSVTSVENVPNFTLTDINNPEAGNGPFCDWTQPVDPSGHCLHTKTALNLLTATINEFNNQNIYVILDFHHRPGLGDSFRDGTVVASDYTLQNYHDNIVTFLSTASPNVMGIDIYNEPHQLYWYQDNTSTSPVQPAWIKVIAAAATAAYDTNQNILLFVEGPGGTTSNNDPNDPVYNLIMPICLPASTKIDSTNVVSLTTDSVHCPTSADPMRVTNIGSNWGENFRALLDNTQTRNGVAKFDTTTFRNMLISAIQTNNFSSTDPNAIANWLLGPNNDGNNGHIVFAPHLYGAEVAGWQSDANDSQIRFKWNFGFLIDSGFPFIVGELGFNTQEPATGGEDFFLNSVAPYLIQKQIPGNLLFWTLNNSDSPPGLRASDSNMSLFAWKEQDLYKLFNAIPPVQQFGKLCVTVPTPTGYTGTAFPVITATGSSSYTFNFTNFDSPTCLSNVVTGTYNLTGSSIVNTNGLNYVPAQAYSASVTQNNETDVTVQYVQQPTGTLQVNVTGDPTNCPISASQQFTVTYTMGSVSNQLQVTGATSATATLPVGSYAIQVTPTTLPSSAQCNAQYTQTVSITANATTQETVNYTYTPPATCSVGAQCSTWGIAQSGGSACNFYIDLQGGMTQPAVFTMAAIGITSLTDVWNATGSITGGSVALTLTDPVNTTNIGFVANGVITIPAQATVATNGQVYNCSVTSSFNSQRLKLQKSK